MKNSYTLADLSTPAAYADDPELATLARKVAAANFSPGTLSRGEFKAAVLRGEHPALVLAAIEAQAPKRALPPDEVAARLAEIQPPAGYRLSLEGEHIVIAGPYSEDLHARIKRLGGVWDGTSGTNRRVWLVAVQKVQSLKRIFGNAAAGMAAEAQGRVEKDASRARAELLRWLGYVEDKAPEGYLYERGVAACRERGIDQHPELLARLEAAIATARAADAARRQKWADEKAAKASERSTARTCRALYPVGRGPALNRPVRTHHGVRVFTDTGKPFRISEDAASVFGAHLLGSEGEQGCYYYWREATAEEVETLRAEEAQQVLASEAALARREAIAALAQRIQSVGDRPDGDAQPAGRRMLDTQNAYGGGAWFVVGEAWIWYCRNNGADGDNWALNNVRTGGAGAIGWRVPYDAALAAQIETLEVNGE